MARGGINKALVQKARESLLAQGLNPTIDAVRLALGNTGSKTTIHRYLKELDATAPAALLSGRAPLSDELTDLIADLRDRLLEEGSRLLDQAQAAFAEERVKLSEDIAKHQKRVADLERERDTLQAALAAQDAELQTSQSSLQTELARNARLNQSCGDLELRVLERDERIRSLEEKHLHARDALEHYRNAVKEQRDQDQRRHEAQVQQIQLELRQLQQIQIIKQEELTSLNRANERLLADTLAKGRALDTQEQLVQRLQGELQALVRSSAKSEGANEQLQIQVAALRAQTGTLADAEKVASARADENHRLLAAALRENEQLRHAAAQQNSLDKVDP